MKKKIFLGFEYFDLSNKEKDDLLKKEKSYTKEEHKGAYIYQLADGKVIYEIKGLFNYLFATQDAFTGYMDATSKPPPIGNLLSTYTHPIKDTFFIEKRELYVAFFAGEFGIEVNLKDTTILDKISFILNKIDNQQIKKYRLCLVALLGEFIVSNVKGAEWKYLNIPNPQKERAPIIWVNGGKMLIDPAIILYEEYNRRELDGKYQINLKEAVKPFIGGL